MSDALADRGDHAQLLSELRAIREEIAAVRADATVAGDAIVREMAALRLDVTTHEQAAQERHRELPTLLRH